jgi:hypothetical protein
MRFVHALLILLLAAGLGLAVFAVMARRAVTLDEAAPAEAARRFEEVRGGFGPAVPLVTLDEAGRPVRRLPGVAGRPGRPGAEPDGPAPQRLHLLVYRAKDGRLARAEVPFWFFELKGPVVRFALRDTDFDLDRLGITPGELERLGPSLVFEETRANGDRVLVWTR